MIACSVENRTFVLLNFMYKYLKLMSLVVSISIQVLFGTSKEQFSLYLHFCSLSPLLTLATKEIHFHHDSVGLVLESSVYSNKMIKSRDFNLF